jgi:predicted nucleotidyltransferase
MWRALSACRIFLREAHHRPAAVDFCEKPALRLSPEQRAKAVHTIRQRLGEVPVWLFGSRVDDAARGGDIDLYVELPQPASALAVARTRGDLADVLEQNVDLVVNDGRSDRPIYAIARETGVRLA